MTQSLPYHDPFAAVPPDVVAAIEEQCGMPIEEAVEKYGGHPILCPDGTYVAIADPPGCGPKHFAAKAEAYRRLLERWAQQERARRIIKAGAGLDAPPAKPRRQRKPGIARLVKHAEKTGKTVTGITATPDGITIHFDETKPSNLWDVAAAALRQKRALQ